MVLSPDVLTTAAAVVGAILVKFFERRFSGTRDEQQTTQNVKAWTAKQRAADLVRIQEIDCDIATENRILRSEIENLRAENAELRLANLNSSVSQLQKEVEDLESSRLPRTE